MMLSTVVPSVAHAAGDMTNTSTTLSTSVNNTVSGGTNVTYAIKFTFATAAQTVASFKLEICDSPLSSVTCVNTGSSSGASFTSATSVSSAVNSGTWTNGASCTTLGTHTGNSALVNCTSGAITATPTATITINGVTNPTANGQFYVRIGSYNTTNAGAPAYPGTDFGATANDTVQQLSVTASVQESLVFAVGNAGTTCANITGTSITLSPNPMGTGAASAGTGKMCANTNANSGYAITYNATGFTGTAGTITPFSTSGGTSSPGTEQFGFNVTNNTGTPTQGAAPSGGTGTCTGVNSNIYCTNNQYAYNTSGATLLANSGGTPSIDTVFTMSYLANIAITTKPGTYTATQTFICTGTF